MKSSNFVTKSVIKLIFLRKIKPRSTGIYLHSVAYIIALYFRVISKKFGLIWVEFENGTFIFEGISSVASHKNTPCRVLTLHGVFLLVWIVMASECLPVRNLLFCPVTVVIPYFQKFYSKVS